MGLKHHTIILVPHERAQFRKWRVSNRQIAWVVAALSVVTLGAGFVTFSFFNTTLDRRELETIQHENDRLKQVNNTFEESLTALRAQLTEYENRTRKLAIVAGLENPPAGGGEAGIGGVEVPATTDPHGLRTLAERVDNLSTSLSEVEQRLEERSRWISATPAMPWNSSSITRSGPKVRRTISVRGGTSGESGSGWTSRVLPSRRSVRIPTLTRRSSSRETVDSGASMASAMSPVVRSRSGLMRRCASSSACVLDRNRGNSSGALALAIIFP